MTIVRFYQILACTSLFISFLFNHSYAQACADPNGIIVVSNTDDAGLGSLREAISCANVSPGANTIEFNIPGPGPHVIEIGSTSGLELPALLDPATIIDARTQPGYFGTPVVVIDGGSNSWSNPINAVWIRSNFCEVYGLEIRNFPDDAIDLRIADNCVIKNNYIHDNGSVIDEFPGAPGTGPWEGCGILIREGSNQNIIAGNIIENNEFSGILVRTGSGNNLIGGPNLADQNQIIANAAGIIIRENQSVIKIQQNSIFCNDTIGIRLVGNANNNQQPPVITQLSTNQITGTGDNGELIELFISDNSNCPGAVCQGGSYFGSATVVNGSWTFNPATQGATPLFGGYVITATATDILGNTSEFSTCQVIIGTSACTEQNGDIVVTNTNDSGAGSLREAINCANNTLGANTIRFEIPGDTIHTIYIGSDANEALPPLLDPATIIDATTQDSFGINGDYSPRIVLDGSQATWTAPINAVWVRSDFCEVYGLEIINFPDDGIDVTLADYVKIGDINKGNVIYSNGDTIDFWPDAPGTGPWNGCGIVLKQGSDFNEVVGNYVGTDFRQVSTAGNEDCGIVIQNGGDNNLIANNVIAHHNTGVVISNGGIRNTLSQNSLYCNDSIPLSFLGNANLNHAAPVIDSASNLYISGLATSLDDVEVFINIDTACVGAPCQGSVYLGTATVVDSTWVLLPPFANGVQLSPGAVITATATDTLGNTSVFSGCNPIDFICDLNASITGITHTSCGANDGSFVVNIINGTAPFLLDIGQGPTSSILFDNLTAGTYALTVTDANNCTATQTVVINASQGVNATASNITNASCNANNGFFTVDVTTGTAPYMYDIGNGQQASNLFDNLAAGNYTVTVTDNVSCTTTVSATIVQDGAPTLTSSVVDETCLQSNGSITVNASGGLPPYTYDIGNGPVSGSTFNNLSAGNYTILVLDANGCSASINVIVINVGIAPAAGFTYTINDDTVSFTNTSVDGDAFTWVFDDGNFSGMENPVHIYAVSDDYEVCVTAINACGTDVYCEMISVLVPLTQVNVGGEIAKENGQTVALVDVNCTNQPTQTTQIDGQYLYADQPVASNFDIVPFKDINYINGCSTFDVFLINQHILDVIPLNSPYKIIAADIDNSGHVSTIDLIRLQQLILFTVDTFPNNTSWRFVPEDYVFIDPTEPFDENFPESINLTNVITDELQHDFVAIKVGDVNLNSNPAAFNDPVDETTFIVEKTGEENGTVLLSFYPRKMQVTSALELSLQIDKQFLDFVDVIPVDGRKPAFSYNEEAGILNLSWFDRQGLGVSSEELVFQLKLKPKSKDWQKGIQLSNQITPRIFDVNGHDSAIKLQFENMETSSVLVAPNPFIEQTTIQFSLVENQEVRLRVFNTNGSLVLEKKNYFEKGTHQLDIDLSKSPGGVYYYEMGMERGVLVKQ